MKKILTIALVALLAASTAFAGLSGSASLGLGYNFEDKTYGFSNDSEVKVTYELTTEEAGEVKEGTVYAGIKASFVLSIKDYKTFDEGTPSWKIAPSLDEAYVAGTDWKVSILGAAKSQDFAASAIDQSSYKESLVATSVALSKDPAPGFTATYKEWTVSAGFANKAKVEEAAVYRYTIADNMLEEPYCVDLTEEAFNDAMDNAPSSYKYTLLSKVLVTKASEKNYLSYSATVATPDFAFGDVKVKLGAAVGDAGKDLAKLGFSGKVAYDTDLIKASIASDLVLNNLGGDEVKVDADIALNAQYSSLVTFDAYYATNAKTQAVITPNKYANNDSVKNLLSLQTKIDLKEYNVPVSLTAKAKNLVNDERVFGVVADVALENSLTFGAGFDYQVNAYGKDESAYTVTGKAGYTYDMFDFAVGITFNGAASKVEATRDAKKQLYFNASVASSKLIPGATLTLGYGPCTNSSGVPTSNLLDENGEKAGKLDFTCKIAF